MTIDVLISGAGPTGLMLATLLARQGVSFRLIEEEAERHKESRALAIHAKSMELFRNLGLDDQFLARGVRGAGVSAYVKGKVAVKADFGDIGRSDTQFPYIFFLSQSVTESILEDDLGRQGFKVERRTTLVQFDQDGDGVTAILKNADGAEEKVRARYLVGCDGARSNVRKSAGLGFAGGTYDAEFMLADAKINWDLPSDRLMIMLGNRDLALLMPLKGSNLSRVVTINDNKADTETAKANLITKRPATVADVQASLQNASSTKATLSDVQWVTRYRIHHRSVERMRIGRVFVAGDAAHIHSPVGGQGMNTGLQDAANLAWKLASVIKDGAGDDLLETYNSERHPVAVKLLNFTDRMFVIAASRNPFAVKFRNFILPIVAPMLFNRPGIRVRLFAFVSQLNIRYHSSVAAVGEARPKKVHAGCRAPDAKLASGGWLLDQLKGYRFNVLVMSRREIGAAERQRFESAWREKKILGSARAPVHWIDETVSPDALATYAVDDVLVSLVRPDGYVGYQMDHL